MYCLLTFWHSTFWLYYNNFCKLCFQSDETFLWSISNVIIIIIIIIIFLDPRYLWSREIIIIIIIIVYYANGSQYKT